MESTSSGRRHAPRESSWNSRSTRNDAQNGRIINPSVDPKLSAVLGKDPVDMLKMTSILNAKHIKKNK